MNCLVKIFRFQVDDFASLKMAKAKAQAYVIERLSSVEKRVMTYVLAIPNRDLADVAQALSLTPEQVSEAVVSLERAGLIKTRKGERT